MTSKESLRRLGRRLGYDVTPFTAKWNSTARRGQLMQSFHVDVVLDVGANAGQYAYELRHDLGFRGRIHSFEPIREAFSTLSRRAADDPMWSASNVGLADESGRATINVAANSESSSLLAMLPAHALAAPESRYVGTEEVELRKLDEIFDDVTRPGERVYLKIDTQGFEGRVLKGAEECLSRIDTVQVEMPLTPLYEGEMNFADLFRLMLDRGYAIVSLEPGLSDQRTGAAATGRRSVSPRRVAASGLRRNDRLAHASRDLGCLDPIHEVKVLTVISRTALRAAGAAHRSAPPSSARDTR